MDYLTKKLSEERKMEMKKQEQELLIQAKKQLDALKYLMSPKSASLSQKPRKLLTNIRKEPPKLTPENVKEKLQQSMDAISYFRGKIFGPYF